MHLVKQSIVTPIGELNHLAQQAHLKFGDAPDTQINIIVGADGKCEVESIAPVSDWTRHELDGTITYTESVSNH